MESRGILLLCDPLRGGSRFSQRHSNTKALVFDENERFLSQAQAALCQRKQECGWVCVAASGSAVGVALALAAQLMVDRLALWMEAAPAALPRQLKRIESYARRNIWLISCEILLIDPSDRDVRRLSRGLGRGSVISCAEGAALVWDELTAPWQRDLFSARH